MKPQIKFVFGIIAVWMTLSALAAVNYYGNFNGRALVTNSVLSSTTGNSTQFLYNNQNPAIAVMGDGTVLWLDGIGNLNITYTNGSSQLFIGRDVLLQGGLTATGTGNWTNGSLSVAGIMTNSASGEMGTSQSIPASWVTGTAPGSTNSIYGGTFGTNSDSGQSVFDAQGNLTHSSTNQSFIQFGREGTNGTPFLLKVTGTNSMVTVSNLTINGTLTGGLINATNETARATLPAMRPSFTGGTFSGFVSGTTKYQGLWSITPANTAATETNVSQSVPSGCTFTNLYAIFAPSLGSGTNCVITLMTNGVASNLLINTSAGNGANVLTLSDTTDGVAVLAGTKVSFKVTGNNPTAYGNNLTLMIQYY